MKFSIKTFLKFSLFIVLVAIVDSKTEEPSAETVEKRTTAHSGEFPYQASLRYHGRHVCGGVVVSDHFILTAASCVSLRRAKSFRRLNRKFFTIRAGSNSIFARNQVRKVASIEIHPNYGIFNNFSIPDGSQLNIILHDLALIKVVKSFDFYNMVTPIELSNVVISGGTPATISGWGQKSISQMEFAENLNFVIGNSLSDEDCSNFFGDASKDILCFQHPLGQGSCLGDGGGPAVSDNALVGIASFYVDRCGGDYPDGFVKISSHYDWIHENAKFSN